LDGSTFDRRELELGRLQDLRDQLARVMLALDEVGLHQAAAHVSMSVWSIDEAAAGPALGRRGTLH
jgi:hypothetical protein